MTLVVVPVSLFTPPSVLHRPPPLSRSSTPGSWGPCVGGCVESMITFISLHQSICGVLYLHSVSSLRCVFAFFTLGMSLDPFLGLSTNVLRLGLWLFHLSVSKELTCLWCLYFVLSFRSIFIAFSSWGTFCVCLCQSLADWLLWCSLAWICLWPSLVTSLLGEFMRLPVSSSSGLPI